MQTKTTYEERILKVVKGLPQSAQQKLVKIVHFLKKILSVLIWMKNMQPMNFYLYAGHGKMTEPLTSR
jgi:hypothetical protein